MTPPVLTIVLLLAAVAVEVVIMLTNLQFDSLLDRRVVETAKTFKSLLPVLPSGRFQQLLDPCLLVFDSYQLWHEAYRAHLNQIIICAVLFKPLIHRDLRYGQSSCLVVEVSLSLSDLLLYPFNAPESRVERVLVKTLADDGRQ